MKLTEVKNILEVNGYEVETRKVNKNGCSVDALSVGNGSIRPSIYEKTVEMMEDEDELLDFVRRIVDNVPVVNVSVMQDKNYILSHCRSCIRHQSDDESIVKWLVFGDLEEYVRIDLGKENNSNMSCVLTKVLLDSLDIDIDELRMHSRRNLFEEAEILSMSEVLASMMGENSPFMDEKPMLYVGSTKSKVQGAAIMLLTDLLDDFCREHELNSITIIPSSTEEILLVTEDVDDAAIDQMVREVNLQVDEWSRLSDHCYHHYLVAS